MKQVIQKKSTCLYNNVNMLNSNEVYTFQGGLVNFMTCISLNKKKKQYVLRGFHVYTNLENQLIYSDREQISDLWRDQEGEGRITKADEQTFWCDRYIHYVDFSDGLMGVCVYICIFYMSKLELYTLNMCNL